MSIKICICIAFVVTAAVMIGLCVMLKQYWTPNNDEASLNQVSDESEASTEEVSE